jgi:hypothetical protein
MNYVFPDFGKEMESIFELIEFVPITRLYKRKEIQKLRKIAQNLIVVFAKNTKIIDKDYNENSIRDFIDAVIFAKNEGLAEGKESAPYLTDKNLAPIIVDLFMGILFKNSNKVHKKNDYFFPIAGIDSSKITFEWLILFMANIQKCKIKCVTKSIQ